MSRKSCIICSSDYKADLDYDLLNGVSGQAVAKKYGIHPNTVSKHKNKCKGVIDSPTRRKTRPLTQLVDKPEINAVITSVADQVDRIHGPLEKLKADAEAIREIATTKEQYGTALSAIEKIAKLIEVQVKLSAEMRDQEKHNELIQKKEWARTQAFIWKFMDDRKLTEEFWDGLAALGTTDSR